MAKVTIYTTPTCSYCKQTKEYFKEKGVEYSEIDVAADAKAAEEMIKKSGQMGVPVIEIDGEMVVGFDKKKFTELLGFAE
jgi:glutaredoxin 3